MAPAYLGVAACRRRACRGPGVGSPDTASQTGQTGLRGRRQGVSPSGIVCERSRGEREGAVDMPWPRATNIHLTMMDTS